MNNVPEFTEAQLAQIYDESNYEKEFVPGEVLVGMRQGFKAARSTASLFSALDIEEIEDLDQSVRDALSGLEADISFTESSNSRTTYRIKLALETRESVLEAIELLKQDPNVAYAEPNYISYPAQALPDDPYYSSLWGMEKIKMPQAWEISTGSHDVKIGVLDSGFEVDHPDLVDNMDRSLAYYPNTNTFGAQADMTDVTSHGTHVAGTIGGMGNNSAGVAGVNWNVTMVPIKIARSNDLSSTSADIQRKAVLYATALGLKVLSMSYGVPNSQSLSEVVSAYDGLFVICAHNQGENIDGGALVRLHALGNVIFVASTDSNDELSSFSNYGVNIVDLAAPGEHIYSTTVEDIDNSIYGYNSGTSMATPLVSGAAALLLSHDPNLSTQELKSAILDNVDYIQGLSGKISTGGRLNVYKALQSVRQGVNLTSDASAYYLRSAAEFTVNVTGRGAADLTGLTLRLEDSSQVFKTVPVVDGAANISYTAAEAPSEPGEYYLNAVHNGSVVASLAVQYDHDPIIWTANFREAQDGKVGILFYEDIAANTSRWQVTLNGVSKTGVISADKRMVIVNYPYSDLAAGDVISIRGVVFPQLWPTYSFIFTTVYEQEYDIQLNLQAHSYFAAQPANMRVAVDIGDAWLPGLVLRLENSEQVFKSAPVIDGTANLSYNADEAPAEPGEYFITAVYDGRVIASTAVQYEHYIQYHEKLWQPELVETQDGKVGVLFYTHVTKHPTKWSVKINGAAKTGTISPDRRMVVIDYAYSDLDNGDEVYVYGVMFQRVYTDAALTVTLIYQPEEIPYNITLTPDIRTYVVGHAADIIVRVSGSDAALPGLTLQLEGGDQVFATAPVVNGTAILSHSVEQAPAESGEYRINAVYNGVVIAYTTVEYMAYDEIIWESYIFENQDGKVGVGFFADITAHSTKWKVTINGAVKTGSISSDNRSVIIDYAYSAMNPGDEIAIAGVKFMQLYPNYSFTFTVVFGQNDAAAEWLQISA